MDFINYVTIASQFMIFGAVIECIVTIIGHVIFSVFNMIGEEGGN